MRKLILILTFYLSFFNEINSQNGEVRINIDSSVFYFGNPVLLSIEMIKNRNEILDLTTIYKFSDVIDILKEEKSDSLVIDKEKIKITKRYLITAYDTGIIKIPPIPIIFKSKNSLDTAFTNSITLYIKPWPIDSTGTIRDIKEIYRLPLTAKEIFLFILIIILILALIIFIVHFLNIKKKKKDTSNYHKTIEPIHIIALRELDNLKHSKLWQKNEIKLFYTILSDIIRKYIKYRFEINAQEMTTDEILKEISSLIDNESYKILNDLLNDADMVKFANYIPEPTDNIKNLDNAYAFINKTKEKTNLIKISSENE